MLLLVIKCRRSFDRLLKSASVICHFLPSHKLLIPGVILNRIDLSECYTFNCLNGLRNNINKLVTDVHL